MIVYLYLAIALVVGYLLGSVNFARIFSWHLAKKDITAEGSKNPGTMNMLRTQGFGRAMLTLAFEALKVGLPALAWYLMFDHNVFGSDNVGFANMAFFLSGFGGIIGHCYPVFYKFKGGKGVACTFGMFVFHPEFWWIALIMFAICFLLFFFIEYGFIISLIFILTMSIYGTCFFVINQTMLWIPLIAILWLNFALVVFLHRGNIKRLANGTENKVNFKEKVFEKKKKNKNGIKLQVNAEAAQENVKEEKKEE